MRWYPSGQLQRKPPDPVGMHSKRHGLLEHPLPPVQSTGPRLQTSVSHQRLSLIRGVLLQAHFHGLNISKVAPSLEFWMSAKERDDSGVAKEV